MPGVGDRVRIESTKVGQAPRDGVVIGGGLDNSFASKWSTGEESTVVPGQERSLCHRQGEGVIWQESPGTSEGFPRPRSRRRRRPRSPPR